jgi:3-deoxy-manno-octulosonate cytidylyltransferase (CMP-KDO synthetase)
LSRGTGTSKHATQAVAIIPARFGSTRFPGKPLARETGKFLIQHVYEQVLKSHRVSRALVATDDQRIFDAVTSFGGQAVMTRPDHASGSDRLAEVAAGLADELILNVQGDEPEIDPADIDTLVDLIAAGDCPMATLACPYPAGGDPDDPNLVKVVLDNASRAIYFSRSRIPFVRDVAQPPSAVTYLLHRGIYAYQREFLLKFPCLSPGRLEQLEKLEQLRAIEHGYRIAVAVVGAGPAGIDTPEQYAEFVKRFDKR